jgi:hypothetical protein
MNLFKFGKMYLVNTGKKLIPLVLMGVTTLSITTFSIIAEHCYDLVSFMLTVTYADCHISAPYAECRGVLIMYIFSIVKTYNKTGGSYLRVSGYILSILWRY